MLNDFSPIFKSIMRNLALNYNVCNEALIDSNKFNAKRSKYFVKESNKKNPQCECESNGNKTPNSENSVDAIKIRWDKIYKNLQNMRLEKDAPVDTMGAHCLFDAKAHPKVKRFHILVSLMLSSQTKDNVTAQAVHRLKKIDFTAESIDKMNEEDLQKIIYPVGFYKRKAKYLKETAKILLEKYGGDIPQTLEELCQLPGVGHKMAFLALDIAWDKVEGIAVDTHVHRISNRLNIVEKPTKTPEKTRIALQSWLPKEHWREINYLLVGFGQQICLPIGPKCDQCLNQNLCPYFKTKNLTNEEIL